MNRSPHPDIPGRHVRAAVTDTEGSNRYPCSGDSAAKPWDTPGLPPRAPNERCQAHRQGRAGKTGVNVLCQYRDDDPARCPICHRRYGLPNGCGKSERCRGAS